VWAINHRAPAFFDALALGVYGAAASRSNCVFCHGVPGLDRGGNIPNLGYIGSAYIENLQNFVYKGAANERGMPDFSGKLTAEEVEKTKAFIAGTADAIRPKK
jgi:quinohemoprotein ethanol dehydrogenase